MNGFLRHSNRVQNDSQDAFAAARELMVERQIRRRGIVDERLLSAMRRVPREEFVPVDVRDRAYDDSALGIGHGQTISQPYTVAYMVSALDLRGGERVLEIGTGSGYGAAVLSLLAQEVHTVERIPELANEARERLQQLGYSNVEVHHFDGTLGLPSHAPFDAIVVTAGAPQLPAAYVEQLTVGGRIVIPIGESIHSQRMKRFTRLPEGVQEEDLGQFAFVPLIGEFGWRDDRA